MRNSMKKFALNGLVLSLLSTPAFAAEMSEKGVRLGLNITNVSGADVTGTSNKNGISVGAFSTRKIDNKVSIRTDVLYSQKGYEVDTASVALNYLEIPVMGQYSMRVSGQKVNLLAGPYLGLLLSADTDGTDVKNTMKAMDYGLQIGASSVIKKQFLIDVRYTMGLASIDDSGADADIANSGFLISGGYLF